MTSTQKVAIAGAVMGSIAVLLIKKVLDRVEEIENYETGDDVPVLQPVRDADPQRSEPLSADDLPVAQNAPF
jgi:hypothetical protein